MIDKIITDDVRMQDDAHGIDFDEAVLRKLDLNLLLVFALVYRHGSVREAANRLYLGSSGASMALKRLRTATGDPLFVRGKQRLEPTRFADYLFERIGPALQTIGRTVVPRAFDPAKATSTLRLAMSEDVEVVFAPMFLAHLAREAPLLNLTIRSGDYQRVARLLDEGTADLVITAQPAEVGPRHLCETLVEEDFVVLSDGRWFDAAHPLDMQTYLDAPHALVSASGASRGRVDQLLTERGMVRQIRVVTENFAALPYLIRSCGLIANVPRRAAGALAEAFGLTIHELPLSSPSFAIAMSWRKRDDSDPESIWLRGLVRAVFLSSQNEQAPNLPD